MLELVFSFVSASWVSKNWLSGIINYFAKICQLSNYCCVVAIFIKGLETSDLLRISPKVILITISIFHSKNNSARGSSVTSLVFSLHIKPLLKYVATNESYCCHITKRLGLDHITVTSYSSFCDEPKLWLISRTFKKHC